MFITYKNGKEYKLDYDDDAHSYKVDGVKVPSVTRIVDACFPKNLTEWAVSVGEEEYRRITDEALEIGNDSHKWIEDYITFGHACTDPGHHIFNPTKAFLKWAKDVEPDWKDAERF